MRCQSWAVNWKWLILSCLSVGGVLRYSEIKKILTGITHKMLSQQLKELERENLVFRNEYHQVPPKVEYSLTEKGNTLIPVLICLSQWGETHLNNGR